MSRLSISCIGKPLSHFFIENFIIYHLIYLFIFIIIALSLVMSLDLVSVYQTIIHFLVLKLLKILIVVLFTLKSFSINFSKFSPYQTTLIINHDKLTFS